MQEGTRIAEEVASGDGVQCDPFGVRTAIQITGPVCPAERLIASLDEDAAVERAWAEEIRRRVDELRSGAVQTIPGGQVFEELEDLFR